jgi:hypothetical protein
LLCALLCAALLTVGVVIWSDEALGNFLRDFLSDRLATSNYVVRLYVNDVTPDPTTKLANFVEASFAGYLAVPGNVVHWSPVFFAGDIAQCNALPIAFTNASPFDQVVYGVFVTNPFGTRLYYAERDPAVPVTIPAGSTYQYGPTIQTRDIVFLPQ